MVDKKEIKLANGETLTVPYIQFGEKDNPSMRGLIGIMGIDFDKFPEGIGVDGNIEVTRLGKLNQQQRYKVSTLQRLMLESGWDWVQFPNPEIIILSQRTKIVLN